MNIKNIFFDTLFRWKFMISVKINTTICKFSFGEFGKSFVNGPIIVRKPSNVIIGDYSTINYGCLLNARESKIRIGNHVHISPNVMINTAGLDLNTPYKNRLHFNKDVVIDDGVWIATSAIVNPGVRIGKGSVVAPGAVVNTDIPEYVFVAGVPAVIKKNLPKFNND